MIPSPRHATLGRALLPLLCCLAALFTPLSVSAAESAKKNTFDLPAGAAGETLKAFAKQAGREIVYSADAVGTVATNAVKGEFTPREALDRMLERTGLVATQDARTGAFAVRPEVVTKKTVDSRSPSKEDKTEGPAIEDNEVQLDPFIVSGQVLSLRRAIAEKRALSVVSDTVSADEIGSIPDFGLGEALERVPGVSMIINNGRGESQFATLRGLNADYNAVLIDGLQLPSTETNRRNVSLDVIPSSLAKNISALKTFTPEMDGNAIGAIVNLQTRSAFDGAGQSVAVRANYGFYENQRNLSAATPSGQAELTYSRTFGARQRQGLVLSASYFRRDSSSLNSAIDTYSFYDAAGNKLALTNPAVATATPVPNRLRWLSYDNLRERRGLFGKYEFSGAHSFRAHLTGGYFQHLNDERRDSNIFIQNTAASIKPVFSSATTGTVSSANAQTDYAAFFQNRRIIYGEFGASLDPTYDSRLNFTAHYAIGDYHQDTTLDTYRIANTTSLAYAYESVPGKFAHFEPVNPAFYYDPANYRQFEHGWATDDNRENILTVALDYGYNSNPGDKGFGFKTGAKLRRLDRNYDRWEENYRPSVSAPNTLPLSLDHANDPRLIVPYNGRGKRLVLIDPVLAQRVFEANRSLYPLNSANEVNNLRPDYDLSESVAAVYAMAIYRREAFTAIGGVRYEDTALETTSKTSRTAGGVTAFVDETKRNDYKDLLPSMNLIYDLSRDLRLRVGASQSLSRPNYNSLASRTVVTDNGLGSVSIQTGNPALKPRESTNTDLSLEWYFSKASMISAAVFRKDLRNEFLTVRSSETTLVNGINTTINTSSPRNLDRARIDGFELSFTATRLRFLPAALAGFGVQSNLTLLNIDTASIVMSDGTQRKLPSLLESPKRTLNATLLYGRGKFSAQVSYKYTAPMLVAISSSNLVEDRFFRANEIYDAQVRYKFSKQWSVTLQAKNFTNNRPTRVIGLQQELLREELDNGRSWFLGATYQLK